MKNIRLMATNELGHEVYVCDCKILGSEAISREEKNEYAEFLVEKEKEKHPEYKYFYFEKDYSYFDEEECWDYFWTMATEHLGLEGKEAEEYTEQQYDIVVEEHYDLGFDYKVYY